MSQKIRGKVHWWILRLFGARVLKTFWKSKFNIQNQNTIKRRFVQEKLKKNSTSKV